MPLRSILPSAANLVAATTLSAGQNIGALIDLNGFRGAILFATAAGTNASSTLEVRPVFGGTTLSGTAAQGATSLTVGSATGIVAGSRLAIENEMVTVTGVSGTTVSVSALQRAKSGGAAVYLLARPICALGFSAMAASSDTISVEMGCGVNFAVVVNSDGSNAVSVQMALGQRL